MIVPAELSARVTISTFGNDDRFRLGVGEPQPTGEGNRR